MEFKKMIFVLAITSILIMGGLFGTSYAYYVSTDGTYFNVTTGNFDDELAVVFNQSEYINFRAGVPILANEVDTKASKNTFTIIPDSAKLANYDVAVSVSLINLEIADALKVSDFKYKFICNNGSSNVISTTGDGTSFTSSVLENDSLLLGSISTSDNSFAINKTYNCTLSVWLQENNSDQNALMNKKFSGLIKVGIAYRNK